MEILINEHVCDTKIPVLDTYLRAMANLANSEEALTVKELVPGKDRKTISRHFTKMMEAGYAFRWENKIQIGKNEFRSLPNDYFPLNPTHILYVDKVDEATAYLVQKFFGKVNASRNTIEKYKGILNPSEIRIVEMTDEDFENKKMDYVVYDQSLKTVVLHLMGKEYKIKPNLRDVREYNEKRMK